jgi:hypothetical protein
VRNLYSAKRFRQGSILFLQVSNDLYKSNDSLGHKLEKFNSAYDLAFDVKNIKSKTHTVLPTQTHLYAKIYPHPEDAISHSGNHVPEPTKFPHLIHEMHMMRTTLDETRFKAAVMGAIEDISLLRSRIYRNDRIIDADVEGFIEKARLVDVDSLIKKLEGGSENVDEVSTCVANYLREEEARHVNPLLKCLWVGGTGEASNKTFLIFVASAASLDHYSLSAVARVIIDKYVLEYLTSLDTRIEFHEQSRVLMIIISPIPSQFQKRRIVQRRLSFGNHSVLRLLKLRSVSRKRKI